MMLIVDAYPVVKEFGPHSCTCSGIVTGCAVCSTAAIMLRNGVAIPVAYQGETEIPDMRTLGTHMGNRHRAADPSVFHGLSLTSAAHCSNGTWCAYCGYLELKAHSIAVAYGKLTLAQFRAHAKAGHPMMVRGDYGALPVVWQNTYSKTTPARGRSDSGFSGAHMMVVWGAILSHDGTIARYIVSDPDFGSAARPVVPPHSELNADVLERYWANLGHSAVTYMTTKPPPVFTTDPPPPPKPLPGGTVLRYGGRLIARGQYVLTGQANVRSEPRIPAGVPKSYPKGTTFACGQTTYAGTNVNGSATWHGTADGKHWVHDSVVRANGHTTGKEKVR